jgi:hypothetical protein
MNYHTFVSFVMQHQVAFALGAFWAYSALMVLLPVPSQPIGFYSSLYGTLHGFAGNVDKFLENVISAKVGQPLADRLTGKAPLLAMLMVSLTLAGCTTQQFVTALDAVVAAADIIVPQIPNMPAVFQGPALSCINDITTEVNDTLDGGTVTLPNLQKAVVSLAAMQVGCPVISDPKWQGLFNAVGLAIKNLQVQIGTPTLALARALKPVTLDAKTMKQLAKVNAKAHATRKKLEALRAKLSK